MSRGKPVGSSVAAIGVALVMSCAGSTENIRSAPPPRADELRRPIRFDRAYRVGERTRIEIAGARTQHRSLSMEGVPPRSDDDAIMARFEAHSRIDAVNARGFPTRVHYDVVRFESERDGAPFEALASGDRIGLTRAASGDEARIVVNDQPATPRQREALGLVLTLTTGDGHPSTNDVYGSETPRSPGETWIVTDRASTQQVARDFHIERGLVATSRYNGAVVMRGVNCMELVMALEGELAPPPGMPAGIETARVTMRTEARTRIPYDARIPASQAQFEMLIDTEERGTTEGRAFEIRMQRRVQLNAVALPDDGS